MTLNRYARKRDANEAEIVAALEAAGCSVLRVDPVDLIVGRRYKDFTGGFGFWRDTNFLLEVKLPGAKLNKRQKALHESWRGQIAVVETVEQALVAVGVKEAP